MAAVPLKPLASGGGRGSEDLVWSASGDEVVFPCGRLAVAMQTDLLPPGMSNAHSPASMHSMRRG